MSDKTVVWDEFKKRRGLVVSPLDVYEVPKGYKVITVAHPRLGAEASAKYREYMSMGFQPMKEEPKNSPFGIGVTNDGAAARQSHDKASGHSVFIPAYEIDSAGNVCLPGKREVVMIGREAVAAKFREMLEQMASEELSRVLEIQETADSPGFAGAVADAAPEEAEAARNAVTAEADKREKAVRKKAKGGS